MCLLGFLKHQLPHQKDLGLVAIKAYERPYMFTIAASKRSGPGGNKGISEAMLTRSVVWDKRIKKKKLGDINN